MKFLEAKGVYLAQSYKSIYPWLVYSITFAVVGGYYVAICTFIQINPSNIQTFPIIYYKSIHIQS
jgi:hypothetical protein